MEVQPTRPSSASQDVLGHKKTEHTEGFAASNDGAREGKSESDVNTRLSREPDSVELSDEGQSLARRFEEGPE